MKTGSIEKCCDAMSFYGSCAVPLNRNGDRQNHADLTTHMYSPQPKERAGYRQNYVRKWIVKGQTNQPTQLLVGDATLMRPTSNAKNDAGRWSLGGDWSGFSLCRGGFGGP